MTRDFDHLKDWIGRSSRRSGVALGAQADIMNATLDRDDPPLAPGDPIPPGYHMFFTPEVVKLSETGPDGHAKRGGFMPPVDLPRRMWGASRLTFHKPLRAGEAVEREITIQNVAVKEGRTGLLVIVTVKEAYSGESGICVEEERDLLYREAAKPGAAAPAPQPAPDDFQWRRRITPTPVMLFRYSALTMNSHRIHYDQPFTTKEEGYPGLLVHGPLTMTLILDLFRREMPKATLKTFHLKALAPLFDTVDFTVEGRDNGNGSATLWARTPEGGLAQLAEAVYAR